MLSIWLYLVRQLVFRSCSYVSRFSMRIICMHDDVMEQWSAYFCLTYIASWDLWAPKSESFPQNDVISDTENRIRSQFPSWPYPCSTHVPHYNLDNLHLNPNMSYTKLEFKGRPYKKKDCHWHFFTNFIINCTCKTKKGFQNRCQKVDPFLNRATRCEQKM